VGLPKTTKAFLGLRTEEKIFHYPSSIWRLLGDETRPEDLDVEAWVASQKEDLEQILAMKRFVSLTSTAFTKYASNRVFIKYAISVLAFLQQRKSTRFVSGWVLNDQTCRSVLKTIQEERKAQNQVDAAILRSK
jgi:hypothetical protein